MEGGSKSTSLAEFSYCDMVAACSDQTGGKDKSGLAVCEDRVGFVGDSVAGSARQ